MSEISFEEQLRLEEEEKRRNLVTSEGEKEADEFGRVFAADGLSYTDKDGCVLEWDAEKSAWFPKIDEDFIARYQMNYGVEGEKQPEAKEEKKEENSEEAYRQWYAQYQQWYNSQIKDSDNASIHSSGEGSEGGGVDGAGASGSFNDLPPMPEDPNSEEYREWYAKWMERNIQPRKKRKKMKEPVVGKDTKSDDSKVAESDSVTGGGGEAAATGAEDEVEEDDDEEEGEEDEEDEEEYTHEDYMRYWNYYYAPVEKDPGEEEKVEIGKKRKNPPSTTAKDPPSWFDVEDRTKNTNVYVSNLPLDITMDEYKDFMSKVGIIMIDEATRQPKIKLYTNETGENKGDGRCCFLKYESVVLAEQILDGYDLKGKKVRVEQAKFALKGEFNPALRKKKKNKKKKNAQEKLLEWQLEKGRGQRAKREKTTILKNIFTSSDFDVDPARITVLRDAIKTECAQFGDVKKVVVHDRNPEGVVSVIFAEAENSDTCIAAMHDRLRAGRKITAECWDGKTKYDIQETEEERAKRIQKWQKYLAGEEDEEEDKSNKDAIIEPQEEVNDKSVKKEEKEEEKEEEEKEERKIEDDEPEEEDDEEDAREDERQNDFLENDDED